MPSWLAVENLRVHLELPSVQEDSDLEKRMTDALNAAMGLVDSRTSTAWDDADAVPAVVREAGLLQAGRFFKRQSAPFGIAQVGSMDAGQGMRLMSRLDPDVELLLADYPDYAAL